MSKVVEFEGVQIQVPDNFKKFECSNSGIKDGVYQCTGYKIVTTDGSNLVCTKYYEGSCIRYENEKKDNTFLFTTIISTLIIIILILIFLLIKKRK